MLVKIHLKDGLRISKWLRDRIGPGKRCLSALCVKQSLDSGKDSITVGSVEQLFVGSARSTSYKCLSSATINAFVSVLIVSKSSTRPES